MSGMLQTEQNVKMYLDMHQGLKFLVEIDVLEKVYDESRVHSYGFR